MPLSCKELSPTRLDLGNSKIFYISNYTGNRIDLRDSLKDLLEKHHFEAPDALLDLHSRPTHPTLNISLSHSKDTAVIGWSPLPHRIGVDTEHISRIQRHLIQRVSTDEEMSLAPQLELLWSTKEAVFKSHSETIEVITSVEIMDWQSIHESEWSFKARLTDSKESQLGVGEIRIIQGRTICFFLANH